MCNYARNIKPELELRIHTNGGARNTRWWTDLRQSLPDNHVVIFALDGLEDTHRLYRIGTTYDTVIRNAKAFIDAGGTAEWVFIKFRHNEHQVEEAQKRATELGFKRFTVKNTIRFIGETKFSVLNEHGEVDYYIEPPTANNVVLIDYAAVERFRSSYKTADVRCYAQKNNEIYIDAHKNLFPCCFLASAPYNNTRDNPIVGDIRSAMVDQYHVLVDSLGGIDNLNCINRSVKDIVEDDRYQSVWAKYWGEDMLMTCARVCGANLNFSKPNDQFEKRSSING
jgi:MoaA/NifB/PqqE/SkfB family radical SAM enzyme